MSEAHGQAGHSHGGLPEPKTPMWLPALGAVLFLFAGLLWGLWPSGDGTTSSPTGGADAGAAGRP
jgi:hypothetical protein